MPQETDFISILGARQHNLKNVSLKLPKGQLVILTGPSGSGKSSLAFDTIFAEGQRRYIESLSPYARQFLGQLSKPDVDWIEGLSPSLAIEQKTISSTPRSTVGTITSIYDFIRLLYARQGKIRDPESGKELEALSPDQILSKILKKFQGSIIEVFASVYRGKKGEFLREFEKWRKKGFSKILIDETLHDLFDPILLNRHQHHTIDILLDVINMKKVENPKKRIAEALRISKETSKGWVRVRIKGEKQSLLFNQSIDSPFSGQSFPDLEPRLFSFNSTYGMCPTCRGIGMIEKQKNTKKGDPWNFPPPSTEVELQTCPDCQGKRLNPESLSVYFQGDNVHTFTSKSCDDLEKYIKDLLPKLQSPVSTRLISEILKRLQFLINVGVGYLSLNRSSSSLSGGEAQRIRLATQLGSQLCGVLYVLDEPSIGLHPKDQKRLIQTLKALRDLGNSVLVVEHDEETMLAADYILELGPGAGEMGGSITAQGTIEEFKKNPQCLSAKYLKGDKVVSKQRIRRKDKSKGFIELLGCQGHNLKNVSLSIPLNRLTVFTGVSGSGKSSLVNHTLERALAKQLYRSHADPLPFKSLKIQGTIDKVVRVNQKPIGRTPRSNPATYTGLFTLLRNIFSQTQDAHLRGYDAGFFSFNVKNGHCEDCEGAGRKKLEMHFLPDVYIPCEVCNGQRYRREVLQVRFKEKNISEVLDMSIQEASIHFKNQPLIQSKLSVLNEIGLGYIRLGQSATTLSGGEAQRIKLSKELSKKSTGHTLYFLDEPSTGLHFEDIKKLLEICQRLCDRGNTVIIIEHNLDIITAADWIIELGPGAGKKGGDLIFEGTPEDLASTSKETTTGSFVRSFFKKHRWEKRDPRPQSHDLSKQMKP